MSAFNVANKKPSNRTDYVEYSRLIVMADVNHKQNRSIRRPIFVTSDAREGEENEGR